MRDCGSNSFTCLTFIILRLWECGTAGAIFLLALRSLTHKIHLSSFNDYGSKRSMSRNCGRVFWSREIAMFLVTSPIVINVPTRGLLAVETMHAIVQWLENLNIKRNMTSMFVNKKHRYRQMTNQSWSLSNLILILRFWKTHWQTAQDLIT